MSEEQKKNLPEGATLLEDGKHFQLKNEKYGGQPKVEKSEKKSK